MSISESTMLPSSPAEAASIMAELQQRIREESIPLTKAALRTYRRLTAIEMRREGYTISSIAQFLGCSPTLVSRTLRAEPNGGKLPDGAVGKDEPKRRKW
jgi:predicted transcriptional regulator